MTTSIPGRIDPRPTTRLEGTDAAQNAERVRAKPDRGDIFVSDGQLFFSEPAGKLEHDVGLAKAKKLLQVARAEASTKMTFGGRVANTGIDPQASLRNYYPSLKVARRMADHPELLRAIAEFLGDISVPEDLADLLRASVDFVKPFEAEPAEALGTITNNANNLVNFARQAGNANQLAVDDDTIRTQIATGWWQNIEQALAEAKDEPTVVAQFRIFARTNELGLTTQQGWNVTNWAQSLARLPKTDEGASVALRLVKARGEDPANVTFHGAPLSEWGPRIPEATAKRSRRRSTSEQSKPLGTITGKNNQAVIAAARAGQVDQLALDDNAVRTLAATWGNYESFMNDNQLVRLGEPKVGEVRVAMLRLWARLAEVGNPAQMTNWPAIAQVLPDTDEAAAVLARAMTAAGAAHAIESIEFHGRPLATAGGRVRVELGKRPAGTESLASAQVVQQRFGVYDASALAIDDASFDHVRSIYQSPYHFPSTNDSAQDKGWTVGVLKLWERGIELGKFDATYLQHFVQQRIQGSLVNDADVMAHVARLVEQGGLGAQAHGWVTTAGVNLGQVGAFTAGQSRLAQLRAGATGEIPRQRVVQYDVPGGTPVGNHPEAQTAYNARDPKLFEASDEALARDMYNVGNPSSWFNHYGSDVRAFAAVARIVELAADGKLPAGNQALAQARAFLAQVPHNMVLDETIPQIARMAKAVGVEFEHVRLHRQDGSIYPLSDDPRLKALRRPDALSKAAKTKLDEHFAALDPSADVSHAQRRNAVLGMLAWDDERAELSELLPRIIDAIADGKLEPGSMSGVNIEAQLSIAENVLDAWPHVVVGPILLALTTRISPERIQTALEREGVDEDSAKSWANVAGKLQTMSGEELRTILAPYLSVSDEADFTSLPLRVALSGSEVTTKDLETLHDTSAAADPVGLYEALLDEAAASKEGSAKRKVIVDFLKAKADADEGTLENIRAALRPETVALLAPEALTKVEGAVTEHIKAGVAKKDDTAKGLVESVLDGGKFADVETLARTALGQLYQADLANVLPLGQADQELGGVAAALFEAKRPFPEGTKTVTVAGVEVAENSRSDRDVRAVPRKQHSDLVMTRTTQLNLKLMAAAWRQKRPVLLEGPTSSGKTSAVRYLAYKTNSPYRRINLSYFTDVSDLLGKYVGGENRYSKPDLDKMSDAEFAAVSEEYGVPEGASREVASDQILAAQLKPRWVDGPVIRAMKKGEVLLLDEMNLARPEVLERLNSLFDDDGNVVLTEHHNEVIAPDDDFRLFATMNPASYSGRARLSDAMRSRWNNVFAHGLTRSDLTQIMSTVYGSKLPTEEMAKLVAVHDNLSRLADEGDIGRQSGGVAFTLRNLFRAADRFVRYSGGELSDEATMRREVEELYLGGLFDPEDVQAVKDILTAAMPYSGPDFYEDLELKEDKDTFTIGDVTLAKVNAEHALVPGESARLVMTKRTTQIMYRLAKALDMGENVAMVGARASGKTAMAKMFAMLRGQPYQRQLLSGSTDGMQLIGGYDDTGWKDGLLLDAARPENVPGVFVGDEFNLANPALLERLNSVLDDERKIVLAEKEGEEVRLHPQFRFIAAMNPPTKEYGGRSKLSKAMQNRFTMIAVPDLDEADEQKEILRALGKAKGVSEAITDTLVDLHMWIQSAYESETLGKDMRERDRPVYSVRQLMNATNLVSEFSGELGPATAYLLAVQATYAASSHHEDNDVILEKAQEMAK